MRDGRIISAVITCAGQGTRFGSNKLLVNLGGMTVLERTVRALSVDPIDEVIVTASADNADLYRRILGDAALDVTIVIGGAERHLSARHGLQSTRGEIVVVHDGVRPFVQPSAVSAVVDAAMQHGAAMLGTPSTVQIKLVGEDGFVQGSLERQHSWMGQTPQAFDRDLLEKAYDAAVASGYSRVSDDADLVHEFTGTPARMLAGSAENIKITTPQDLATARLIAQRRSEDR